MTVGAYDIYLCLHNLKYIILLRLSPFFHLLSILSDTPPIHEHDNKRAQAFAIIENGKVVLLYTYETDLGDGWEDQAVHNNSQEKRRQALQMGANIVMYAFTE